MEENKMEEMIRQETQTNEQPVQAETEDIETRIRAHVLMTQAKTIEAVTGVDVMHAYTTDVDIRNRVLSGAWDFMDVWKSMAEAHRAAPPAPVRNANGGIGAVNIGGMNEEQFEKLNSLLRKGGKVDMSL